MLKKDLNTRVYRTVNKLYKMELLETAAQSHEIEKIIENSQDYLILVSPYLQINNRLKPKLSDCFKRNNKNLILYREQMLSETDLNWFDKYKNVFLIPIRNLHAKCYLNEEIALITSMNLLDYSQVNNHEIGVLLSEKSNKESYEKLLSFINSIIRTDYTDSTINHYIGSKREYTMGQIYTEMSHAYEFPKTLKEMDSVYVLMSNLARTLYQFDETDLKKDGNTLLRSTVLTEAIYNKLKVEIPKLSLQNNSDSEKEKYTYSDFNTEWFNHLKSRYSDYTFTLEDGIVIAKNFPTKNVDFSSRYGFASFEFNLDYSFMKKQKNALDSHIYNEFKYYRLFWNPYDRINIYHAKNSNFKSIKDDIKYCSDGLTKIIKEIKKFA